jgi:hypothetical protein
MIEIPTLKHTDLDFRKYYIDSADDIDDYVEKAIALRPSAILDIFSRTLNADDAEIELLSDDYFRLSQEYKYLNFIEKVFELNEKKCYAKAFFSRKTCLSLLDIIHDLDRIDKYLLFHQTQSLNLNSGAEVYLADDVNLLKTFLRSMLRETWMHDLYFDKKPLLLCGGYDLSLPIVFNNNDDMRYYEKIANECGLFFRT